MSDPLDLFHPAVSAWFRESFPGGPTPAQTLAWPAIAAGRNVLLVSPTGTGKTLAAFLVALDGLVKRKLAGDAEPALSVLYVSPLKALDNDVARNLERPREGIRRALENEGLPAGERAAARITTAVRTGDTAAAARREQLRRPPDVLITTPESLYILLTGAGRALLSTVSTVILDEIHSVAGTKRGSHLALSLERLEALVTESGRRPPQRVALSATVEPVAEVAAFAGGAHRVESLVVDARKSLDLAVVSPKEAFGRSEDGSAWEPAIEAIAAEAATRRTTLVFCNNRRHAERIAAKLEEKLGHDVPTHHGSVARALREEIERDLKAGSLRILVATGSLELGLDVGEIDSVVQIGSPKGVARALQRVGRSGHLVGQTARGRLVPLFLDDLYECAATVEGMREGDVEETRPPEFPLDVLAQQIVAEAVGRGRDGTTAAALLEMFRRARPYRALPDALFFETLAMLSGKYPKERFAALAPKLVWDRATDRVAALPGARLAALLDGGTIGDRGTFRAVLRDGRTVVGDLDEEFVYETRAGDVFLLGSRAWRAVEISHDRVVVEDAAGEPARMPFWKGEGLGRTAKLAARVGRLKRTVAERLDDPALPGLLAGRYGCDPNAASALTAAVRREAFEPYGIASDLHVVFETFPNDLGDPCVLVRSLFGRGVNLPWSLALASVLSEETGVEAEAVATDDGILLRLPRAEREIPLERLARLTAAEARERLLAELPNSALFGARFRENAQRALLLPRARSGRRTPFWLQRLRAKDLLQTTRQLPDFPIVAETYRDCLKDQWESERLFRLLDDLASGAVARSVDVRKFPSPAAQGLLFTFVMAYMYEWDAPKAERGLHALAMNRELLGEVLGETLPDTLRPEAADAARAEASRLVAGRQARTPDELLLLFQELGDLTEEEIRERSAEEGKDWLNELTSRGSVTALFFEGEKRWIASEDLELFEQVLGRSAARVARGHGAHNANGRGEPASRVEPFSRVIEENIGPLLSTAGSTTRSGLQQIVLRFFSTRGPATGDEFTKRYGIPAARVEEALEALRLDALVVRGRFGAGDGSPRWAGARLAESVRRKTFALLRGEIRPVPVSAWRAFVAKRQGLALGARFGGTHAAERALALLRGLPLPALSVETAILPARLAAPEPDALDVLSARGLLVWRASGTVDPRAARLSFFFRGEGAVVLPPGPPALDGLTLAARDLYGKLAVVGASFLADLVPKVDGKAEEAVRKALVELVLAGLVTGDGIQGFREILLRKRGKDPELIALAEPRPGAATRFGDIGNRPSRSVLRAAEQQVTARLRLSRGASASLPLLRKSSSSLSAFSVFPSGRWSLVDAPGVFGEPLRADERAEAWARILLARWGVVSRAVLELEDQAAIRWSDVAPVLARMEMRGDLRRGTFVETHGPLQYAEEETIEALRSRAGTDHDEPALAVAGGGDPALAGLDPAPSRDSWIALSDGEPFLRLDADGAFTLAPGVSDRTLRAALAALQDLFRRARDPLGRPRRLRFAASLPPLAPLLENLGFVRDGDTYVWRSF